MLRGQGEEASRGVTKRRRSKKTEEEDGEDVEGGVGAAIRYCGEMKTPKRVRRGSLSY